MKVKKINFWGKPKGKLNMGIPKRDRVMPVKLFGDKDKDGVPNVFDCKPRNRRKQGFLVPITNPKRIRKYLPQIQTITTRMESQFENRRKKAEDYIAKVARKGITRGRQEKIQRMKRDMQMEDTGLFDFILVPGVQYQSKSLPHYEEKARFDNMYKNKGKGKMSLIVEKGIVKGEISTKRKSPDTVELKSIYVLPEYRKQGVGKKVIKSLFKNPQNKKVVGIAIPNSREYLMKMGAKQTGIPEEREVADEYLRNSFEAMVRGLESGGMKREEARKTLLSKENFPRVVADIQESGWPNTLKREEFENLEEKEEKEFREEKPETLQKLEKEDEWQKY